MLLVACTPGRVTLTEDDFCSDCQGGATGPHACCKPQSVILRSDVYVNWELTTMMSGSPSLDRRGPDQLGVLCATSPTSIFSVRGGQHLATCLNSTSPAGPGDLAWRAREDHLRVVRGRGKRERA